jgi:hypothetical protein
MSKRTKPWTKDDGTAWLKNYHSLTQHERDFVTRNITAKQKADIDDCLKDELIISNLKKQLKDAKALKKAKDAKNAKNAK